MKVCPKCLKRFEDELDRCNEDNRALLPLEGDDPALGEALGGRFLLTGFLGRGAMGAVYKGYQLSMRRFVAVKVLLPHIASSDQHVQRFIREATSAAQLKNPHTVTLYDFGETDDGRLFIAMELLAGDELADILAEKERFSVTEALGIVSQACLSLEEAHERGIIHRDLKPANIMIEERPDNPHFVKIVDFGIAKLLDEGATMVTQDGSTCGTPSYMAPEQVMGKKLDARTDIYALGVVLFELLTGKRPFMDTAATAILLRHLQEPIPSVLDVYPDLHIPATADAIIQRCVAKTKNERYSSCLELREACLAILKADVGALSTEAYREVKGQEGTVQTVPMGDDETAVQDVVEPPSPSTRGFEATETQDAAPIEEPPDGEKSTVIIPPPDSSAQAVIPGSGQPRWLWPSVGGIVVLLLVAAGLFVMSTNKREGAASENNSVVGGESAISSTGEAARKAPEEGTKQPAPQVGAGPDMVAPPDAGPPSADVVAPPVIAKPDDIVAPPDISPVADVAVVPEKISEQDAVAQQPAQGVDVAAAIQPVVKEEASAAVGGPGGSKIEKAIVQNVDEELEKELGKEFEKGIEKEVDQPVEKTVKQEVDKKEAPRASVTGLKITGSVAKSDADRVLRGARKRLNNCLGKPGWPGRGLSVTVMHGPDGKAQSVRVEPGGGAADCVRDELESLTYPSFTGNFSILRFKIAK